MADTAFAVDRGEAAAVFTGIIEEIGEVTDVQVHGDDAVLTVRAAGIVDDLTHGASIAVNGVCLTVVGWQQQISGAFGNDAPLEISMPGPTCTVEFDVMGETLQRSVIGSLRPGHRVNLERAVRVDARLDGHVVQGHVDGTGHVVSRTPGSRWELVRFAVPAPLARYVAEKGSIAVDGVSLTVAAVGTDCQSRRPASGDDRSRRNEQGDDWFEVGLIPETLKATTLGARQPGDAVNLEVDVLAKYVERLMAASR